MYSKVNDLLLILPDVKVEEPNSKEVLEWTRWNTLNTDRTLVCNNIIPSH